jgi:hypothetical protein
MRRLLTRFWHEEDGFLVAGDLVFVATILILGAAISAMAVRARLLEDIPGAVAVPPAVATPEPQR